MFTWAAAKGRHERVCNRASGMANLLEEKRGALQVELVDYLMKKREPVIAYLAEIDSMIRALGGK